MVAGARSREQVIPEFWSFCEEDILIGHNLIFDYSFIHNSARSFGYVFDRVGIDTLSIARSVQRELPSKESGSAVNITAYKTKRPTELYHDALATAKLYPDHVPLILRRNIRIICGETSGMHHPGNVLLRRPSS